MRLAVATIAALALLAIARRRLSFVVPLEPDPYAKPVPMTWTPDTRNAITIRYLVGPTGVRSSMN